MILQAYIDDSYKRRGQHVFGGFISSAERWAEFAEAWNDALEARDVRDRRGVRHFKMTQMAKRSEDLPIFYNIIRDHVALSIAHVIDAVSLENAINRVWSDNTQIIWGPPTSIMIFSMTELVTQFYRQHADNPEIERILGKGNRVEFIFDKQSEEAWVRDGWDDVVKTAPRTIRNFFGPVPQFKTDEGFPPLQAADLWAWQVREAFEQGRAADLSRGNFGSWSINEPIPSVIIHPNEDSLVNKLLYYCKLNSSNVQSNFYDANIKPKTVHEIPAIRTRNRQSMIKTIASLLRRDRGHPIWGLWGPQ